MSTQPTPWLANPAMQKILAPLLVGAFLLGLWQALCVGLKVPVYLVPSPMDIGRTLITDGPMLLGALWMTLKITFLSFALAVVLGVAAAFLFVQSRIIEASLFPYAILLQVTPVVAVVDPDFVPVPQPSEVAEVFEVPLDYLMAADNLRQVEINHRGRIRHVLEYSWPGQRIWGATAAILYNLRRRLEQVQ